MTNKIWLKVVLLHSTILHFKDLPYVNEPRKNTYETDDSTLKLNSKHWLLRLTKPATSRASASENLTLLTFLSPCSPVLYFWSVAVISCSLPLYSLNFAADWCTKLAQLLLTKSKHLYLIIIHPLSLFTFFVCCAHELMCPDFSYFLFLSCHVSMTIIFIGWFGTPT